MLRGSRGGNEKSVKRNVANHLVHRVIYLDVDGFREICRDLDRTLLPSTLFKHWCQAFRHNPDSCHGRYTISGVGKPGRLDEHLSLRAIRFEGRSGEVSERQALSLA